MTVSQLLFQISTVSQIDPKIILFLIIFSIFWVLPWKGVALWKAAKNSDKKWFIVIFLLNTLSLIEILYIFIFAKRKKATRPSQTEPDS